MKTLYLWRSGHVLTRFKEPEDARTLLHGKTKIFTGHLLPKTDSRLFNWTLLLNPQTVFGLFIKLLNLINDLNTLKSFFIN